MAVIEEVTAAYEKARGDQAFLDELDRLQRALQRAAVAVVRGGAAFRARRWRADLPQARRPQPHRISQDQQRARPGAAGAADGQDAGDRRDRSRPARGGHRDGVRAARPRVRRLHGRGRHRAAGAERGADAAAGCDGGVGRVRLEDARRTRSTRRSATGSPTRDNTYYCFGTAAGPHPFPTMVRDFQRVIGLEARVQIVGAGGPAARRGDGVRGRRVERDRHLPRVHRRSGRSAGRLRGGGDGVETGRHAATFTGGSPGAFQGSFSYLLQDEDGQTIESHSISAGLDYPGVGPEHAFLKDIGRAEYRPITDTEAMDAFALLCRTEGIIPAIESAHAVAGALKLGVGVGRGRDHPGEPVRPRRQGRRDGGQVVRPAGRCVMSRLVGDCSTTCRAGGPVGADRLPADGIPRRADVDFGDDGDGRIRLRHHRSRHRVLRSRAWTDR